MRAWLERGGVTWLEGSKYLDAWVLYTYNMYIMWLQRELSGSLFLSYKLFFLSRIILVLL